MIDVSTTNEAPSKQRPLSTMTGPNHNEMVDLSAFRDGHGLFDVVRENSGVLVVWTLTHPLEPTTVVICRTCSIEPETFHG